jgi:polysaccharide export outer membrane protein
VLSVIQTVLKSEIRMNSKKMTPIISWTGAALIVLTAFICGCYNDPLDPTQIGRFEPTPKVNVILDNLGVAEEPSPTYEGTEEPRPEDLVDYQADYTIGPGDVVQISIFELYQETQVYVNNYIVTESGRISIPDVGLVQAAGLTEPQLEQEIKDILSPNILKNPSVTATVTTSQKQYFSIVGQGLGTSGRFPLPRYTFRLTDAISLTGSIAEFNLSYIYVSRDIPVPQSEGDTMDSTAPEPITPVYERMNLAPVEPAPSRSAEDELLEIITPSAAMKKGGIVIASAEMATREELEALAFPEGFEIPETEISEAPNSPSPQSAPLPNEPVEWVFENGKWIAKSRAAAPAPESVESVPVQQEPLPAGFGLGDIGKTKTTTRVIRIPVDRLLAGDPQYNIVVRAGDRITVPLDIIGEFWILGNVNSQGPFPLTGRPITLKQAIATAGGLSQIAYPQKVEVIRRLGKNSSGLVQEEIVMVDLKKSAQGLQPDFFIKPYDLVNVGTHGSSRYLFMLRTAFRATYGFGLVYDRNFANEDFEDVWTW